MTVRSEIEQKLATFATTQSPAIPISYEGVPFTKPTSGPYFEVFFLNSSTQDVTVDGTRRRVRGYVQINVCYPDGKGSKAVEAMAEAVSALYPVVPKSLFTSVSIDQSAQIGRAFISDNFRVVPVTIYYRQEI